MLQERRPEILSRSIYPLIFPTADFHRAVGNDEIIRNIPSFARLLRSSWAPLLSRQWSFVFSKSSFCTTSFILDFVVSFAKTKGCGVPDENPQSLFRSFAFLQRKTSGFIILFFVSFIIISKTNNMPSYAPFWPYGWNQSVHFFLVTMPTKKRQ